MRRPGRAFAICSGVVLLGVAATATPGSAQSPAPGALTAAGEAGARLIVEVPAGALPAGTPVEVVARDPADRPAALRAVPMEGTFFELQPADAVFGAPALVTRSVGFAELGLEPFDPLFDGIIVGALFTREADGSWAWLADAGSRLDAAADAFQVTGTTGHAGPILVSVPGDILVATEDDASTPVGSTFRVEGQLRVDPASRAQIGAVTGTTSDPAIATAGHAYVVEAFDRAMGLELTCVAPGTVSYETTFLVRGAADLGPLIAATGLPGVDVTVTHAGEHTCA